MCVYFCFCGRKRGVDFRRFRDSDEFLSAGDNGFTAPFCRFSDNVFIAARIL